MGLNLWLFRIGAMLLAAGAGWCMGRAIPSWQIDRMNEDVPSPSLRRYGHMHGAAAGCGNLIGLFMHGAWGTVLVGIAALMLAYFGWSDALLTDAAAAYQNTGYELLLARPFWLLVVAVIAGYVVSRLTDKGPVGPLE